MNHGEKVKKATGRPLRQYLFCGLVLGLIGLQSTVWVATSLAGKKVGIEPIDALIMEDHSEAFIAWRQASFRKRTIVHIDSHIDVEWLPGPELKRISSAKTAEALRQIQLDPSHPEEESSKPLAIMNFLYPAMVEGMVKELVWVVPDSLMSGPGVLESMTSQLIKWLTRLSIDDLRSFRMQKGAVKGKIYGIPLTICKLSDLPRFNEPVVLDIDVDFFDPPNLGKRIDVPFLWPEEFIALLMKKGIQTDCVTICYSVNGGYLALEYKFLGNELADRLRDPQGSDSVAAEVRELRKAGHIDRSKGRFSEAAAQFQKALVLNPKEPSLHYGLGLVYDQWGKPGEASAEFRRAIELDHLYGGATIFDADYYFNKDLFEKALPLYEKVLAKDPNFLKGILQLGVWSSHVGRLEKAVEYYRAFIEKYSGYYLAYFNLGVTYSRLQQWEKMEKAYQRALELNPYLGKAYQNLGTFYAGRGESDRAIGAFEKAVENNPCFKGSQNNLGSLYAGTGRYDEAIHAFTQAVRIDPQYATGFSNLGKIYLLQGKGDEARTAFQKALSLDAKNPWARYYLGRVHQMMGREPEAIAAHEAAIAADPNFYPAYLDLAKILGEHETDLDRAITFVRKAVEINPAAEAYALLARLCSKRGMDREAGQAIERALQLAPHDPALLRLREAIPRQ